MIGEERFVMAIITQAIEDASYTGVSKKYLKHKVNAIDWILNDENDVAYFGSNWLEGNMGVEYQVIEKFKGVEDFIIINGNEKKISKKK